MAQPKPAPAAPTVSHEPAHPRSGQAVVVTVKVPEHQGAPAATLRYQIVEPGKYVALADPQFKSGWTTLPMRFAGGMFTAELPASVQAHRRLVRYQISLPPAGGKEVLLPATNAPAPNFSYFVYDGVPGWSGAVNPRSNGALKEPVYFSPRAMQRVQVYHLIAKDGDVKAATWLRPDPSAEYRYTGTLVVDGQVYDHVRFRARGGVWRHAMGKNMWKVDFNKGQYLAAKDDYGQPYAAPWRKLNLRACIQQGDYGHRGEQGMFEAVGFRLFNLAGAEAPFTHWIHWRIVSQTEEAPANQYEGDFWGLYLAIENEDGSFLANHQLPEGNIYKMMHGQGELDHQGAHSVTNGSDLRTFLPMQHRRNLSEAWWRTNVNVPGYLSYRTIVEAIHHYDIADGKNYTYYFNPVAKRMSVLPWDIDLTWADNMYGGGTDPLYFSLLQNPAVRREYQNRVREIRDLLFNSEQTDRLIEECAAIIWDPSGRPSLVEADRRKWDYHPVMVSRHSMPEKAGHGKFYEAVPTRDFAGMVQLMKNWVKRRSLWMDRMLANDPAIPETPQIERSAATNLSAAQLTFRCGEFKGAGKFAAMKWRLAEVAPAPTATARPSAPGKYEIIPTWESPELTAFKPSITIPANAVSKTGTYRVRVRMKDDAGRWSHWSAPVEFRLAN